MPGALYDNATDLLDLVVDALTDANVRVPERRYVAAGLIDLIAWDDCTDCSGQLVAGLSRLYRARDFPTQVIETGQCPSGVWVAEYAIDFLGCALTLDDDGIAPAAGELDAEGEWMLSLVEVGICAAMEWVVAGGDERAFVEVQPLGPDGGCVGYRLLVSTTTTASTTGT